MDGRFRAAVCGRDPVDPVDPLDPLDPGMNSKSGIFHAPVGKNYQDVAPVRCFFDFFRTASCETYTVETIFGKTTSQNAFKKYDSVRDIPQKVKQMLRDSLGGLRGSGQLLACRGQLWQSSGSSCGHALGSTLLVRSGICPKTSNFHKSTSLDK